MTREDYIIIIILPGQSCRVCSVMTSREEAQGRLDAVLARLDRVEELLMPGIQDDASADIVRTMERRVAQAYTMETLLYRTSFTLPPTHF